ncbi:hypothetical protein Tco_0116633 [Tanacetum coccineum]
MVVEAGDDRGDLTKVIEVEVVLVAGETEVKDRILTPYEAGSHFLHLGTEAASIPLVGVGLSTSQLPSHIMEDDGVSTREMGFQLVDMPKTNVWPVLSRKVLVNQMEEPKEISNNKNAEQLDVYNVASPRQHVKKDVAEKLYQVLSFCEPSIIQDIDNCKKDEIRINNDIMWFSSCDKRREWKKQHIKNVEKDLRETVNHELPMKSIPRPDDGFLCLTTKRDWYGRQTSPIDVGTDKKRCHNRLNKGRMDLEYSKQVHAELLLPKKPIDGGAQELNCVMESLVHRIQHGNNKRAEEAKLYHEIKNLNDSIEIYTEPTAVNETWRRNWPWRPALPKGYKQQQLKNIKCMERELEEISSLRKKAYKCAYKHGDQQNEVKGKKEAIQFKHMNFEKALEMKNLRMKEAIQFKQVNFENALERKTELIEFKHMNYKNALEWKNLRMKEAIQFKQMNYENALEWKNLRMKEAIQFKQMNFENALERENL